MSDIPDPEAREIAAIFNQLTEHWQPIDWGELTVLRQQIIRRLCAIGLIQYEATVDIFSRTDRVIARFHLFGSFIPLLDRHARDIARDRGMDADTLAWRAQSIDRIRLTSGGMQAKEDLPHGREWVTGWILTTGTKGKTGEALLISQDHAHDVETLTCAEAANVLGIRDYKLTRLVDDGAIIAYGHGRGRRIDAASVLRYQQTQPATKPQTPPPSVNPVAHKKNWATCRGCGDTFAYIGTPKCAKCSSSPGYDLIVEDFMRGARRQT